MEFLFDLIRTSTCCAYFSLDITFDISSVVEETIFSKVVNDRFDLNWLDIVFIEVLFDL